MHFVVDEIQSLDIRCITYHYQYGKLIPSTALQQPSAYGVSFISIVCQDDKKNLVHKQTGEKHNV